MSVCQTVANVLRFCLCTKRRRRDQKAFLPVCETQKAGSGNKRVPLARVRRVCEVACARDCISVF